MDRGHICQEFEIFMGKTNHQTFEDVPIPGESLALDYQSRKQLNTSFWEVLQLYRGLNKVQKMIF